MIVDTEEVNVVIQDNDSISVNEGTPTDIAEIMHNEEIRIANENERIANETQRINNEEDREEYITELKQRVLNGEFDGEDGEDGFSPIANVSKSGDTATISITDKNGTTTATISDGQDGQDGTDGQDGEDGFSPVVTMEKQGKVTTLTITDATGTHTTEIKDGNDGSGTGDMLKATYDTNDNGIVDNAEKVNNHTVLTDVPADAVFTDTTYTAGTGIDITNNVISSTQSSAEWGNITGTLSDQTDLITILNSKSEFIPNFNIIIDKGMSWDPLILDELDAGIYLFNPIVSGDIYFSITSTSTTINYSIPKPSILYIPKKIKVSDLSDKDTLAVFTDYNSNANPGQNIWIVKYDISSYVHTGDMQVSYFAMNFGVTQRLIDSSHKLSADLVDDTSSTNKFVTASEKTTWNNKSDFSGSYTDLTNKPSIPSKTSDLNNDSGFIDKTVNDLTNYTLSSSLSTVATSGSYSDLSNKPTIPDELADLSDDSTHRVVTDTEKTTWNRKQNALVSGSNIKTINNTSLLGSGNIDVGADIPQQDTAPSNPEEDDLWIDTDADTNIITIDNSVSTTSPNPISNQAITNYVNNKILDVYSTNEVKTNKIWINGKPIYRKVIQINTINAGQTVISLNTTNVDEYLLIEGMAYSQTDSIPIPKVHYNNFIYQIGWFIAKSTNSLIIEVGSSISGIIKGYAIIEYTKTND